MLGRRALVGWVVVPGWAAGGGGWPAAPRTAPANAPGTQVPNEGWGHVPEGAAVTYQNNPPASGPHYPVWARYEEHAGVIARPYWVHNLEHGAIVLLYRPDAPAATIAALRDAYRAI